MNDGGSIFVENSLVEKLGTEGNCKTVGESPRRAELSNKIAELPRVCFALGSRYTIAGA